MVRIPGFEARWTFRSLTTSSGRRCGSRQATDLSWLFRVRALMLAFVALWVPVASAQANGIPQLTPGVISTTAGKYYTGLNFSGDGGAATAAEMAAPQGIALDATGNLYIADTNNNVVRIVNRQSTAITVLGVTIQPGNIQTVIGNYSTGGVGNFAGDGGPAAQASLALPTGLTFDSRGTLYIADAGNSRIRAVNLQSTTITVFGVMIQPGDIETVAGGYSSTSGTLCGTATDNQGDGCPGTEGELFNPVSTAFDAAGNLYIAQEYYGRIKKVSAATNIISTVAGNSTIGFSGDGGNPLASELFNPSCIVLDASGNIYIAELLSDRVRVVNTQATAIAVFGVIIQPNTIETVAGSGVANGSDIINAAGPGSTSAGYSGDGGPANQAHLNSPSGIWLDAVGDLYIADTTSGLIREVSAQSGIITTIAGSTFEGAPVTGYGGDGGSATSAFLDQPSSLLLDPSGNIWIADGNNNVIREINTSIADLVFPQTNPGIQSPDQTVTLKNIGGATVTLSNIVSSGADTVDFGASTNCSPTLASGASCTLVFSFAPQVSGALTAAATITETTPAATQTINLSGTGSSTTFAQLSVTPVQLSFSNQVVGTVSAPQPVTITNTGTLALEPSGALTSLLTITGNQSGYFVEADNCGVVLAPQASCTANISFAPQSAISASALLVVEGDARNSPQFVSLSGTGTLVGGGAGGGKLPILQVIPGTINTIAGDDFNPGPGVLNGGFSGDGGPARAAELDLPIGLAETAGGILYLGDAYNQVIRVVDLSIAPVAVNGVTINPGDIQTIAGTHAIGYTGDGGPAIAAKLDQPASLLLDRTGNLYFEDFGNHVVRAINLQSGPIVINGATILSGDIQTIAGNTSRTICAQAVDSVGDGCPATSAFFGNVRQITLDAVGNLYIADICHNVIRAVNMGALPATIAGVTIQPGQIEIVAGTLETATCANTFGGDGGPALSAELSEPFGIAVDAADNLYISDTENFRIRAVNTQATAQTLMGVSIPAGAIATIAGTGSPGYSGDFGPATAAAFTATASLRLDAAGNLYFTDTGNNVVREIFASSGTIRTDAGTGYGAIQIVGGVPVPSSLTGKYTGDGGAATSADLYVPYDMMLDFYGNLLIADGANEVVREVSSTPANFIFPDTKVGSSSAAQIYTFSNISTQIITFSALTVSANFKQVASGGADCTSSITLSAGGICQLALEFVPTEVGPLTGTAQATNTAGVQTMQLSGTGTGADGAVLQSITVAPANPAISKGSTQQFAATGNYSDGSTQNITASVVWASSNASVATVGPGTGLATGVAAGSTQITAMLGTVVSAPDTLTVTTAATLQSIAVTPASPSIAAGSSQQFTATGTYSDSSTQNITTSVTWASSNTSFATIGATTGLAHAVAAGSTQITATLGSVVSAPDTLTVTAATLQSIVVTPANPSILVGGTEQFSAVGTYSDSSTQNITATVAWTSSNTFVATVGASTGLATGKTAGTANIQAALSGISGATGLTVDNPAPTLTSILPTGVTAGSAGFTLTVNGTGFNSSSVVTFNGNQKATTLVSSTQLTAAIAASDVASPASVPVSVVNPAPGGGTASPQMFAITTAPAPVASLSPASLAFPNTVAGATATAMNVTLSNTGNAPLAINNITITGTNPSAFNQTNGCGSALAAGSSCTIALTFSPASAASYSANLSVSDNASGSPQTVSLSGTGTPAPSFTIASSTAPQTVQPGGSAVYSITVSAQNGTFSGTVLLSASGLPAGSTAAFAPASLVPGSTSATSQLTIQLAATTAEIRSKPSGWIAAVPLVPLPMLGLLFAGRKRRRWLLSSILLAFSLSSLMALSGCGGGFGFTRGSTNLSIVVTGTSGAIQQSTTVLLTEQ